MPWRNVDDPYKVFISEVMLQQTQVSRVTEKYHRFISAFPNITSLNIAPLKDILAVWQGLGYNKRANYLKQAAGIIFGYFGGMIPETPEELVRLPGIGPATAASIAVFAFNRPVTFIETNIRSVFIHFFFPGEDRVPDTAILPLVEKTLDTENPREWYYALMDYGVMLKSTEGNPSRRSSHHTRQSAFEGSDRQIRGAVIRLLTNSDGMDARELARGSGCDPTRFDDIFDSLEKDGLIVKSEQGYIIA